MPTPSAFWARVEKGDGCWIWLGPRNKQGYGITNTTGRRGISAHRLAWILENGPIPTSDKVHTGTMWVLHKCDNPPCVRPDHLFLGTPADNHLDMRSKGRQHAPLCGEDSGQAKITEQLVRLIREAFVAEPNLTRVAKKFAYTGIKKAQIRNIVCGKSWSHLGLEPIIYTAIRGSGAPMQGSKHTLAKLDEEKVLNIRQLVADGMPQKDVALKFSVTRASVSLIISRKTWKHI